MGPDSLNIVKHQTFLKHCETLKHHETLVKHHETLAVRCDDISARCGVSGNIGDCGVGITSQMCKRVINP